jgi:4'-phosphopantetheinyl transferase
MPIVKIENLNEECTWGLWKITENSEVLEKEASFSEEEKIELTKISNPRRKKEWLAARVTLKRIMEKLNIPYEGIRKDESCKPYLIRNGYHISLAHSFPYAGAIVNRTSPCGIDIEKPKPALYFIAPKFLSEKEDEYIVKKPVDLCLAWAAKEVMFKLYGKKDLSFKDNLQIQPYKCTDKGQINVRIQHLDYQHLTPLQYEQLEDTVICHSI